MQQVPLIGCVKVPLALILEAFRGKTLKPAHLKSYLYLKFYYPDRFNLTNDELAYTAEITGLNIKTIRSHISALIKHNWLGLDKKTNRIYVRSKDRIIRDKKTKARVAISEADLKNFNSFCVAVAVAYLSRRYHHPKSNKPVPTNAGAITGLVRKKKYLKAYAPLALEYVGNFLSRSKSWVDKYKQVAIQLKYIKRKGDFKYIKCVYEERKAYVEFAGLRGQDRFKLKKQKVNGKMNYEQTFAIVAIDLLASTVKICR